MRKKIKTVLPPLEYHGDAVKECELMQHINPQTDRLAMVDCGIVKELQKLNNHGFRTYWSCSGLASDHKKMTPPSALYVAFHEPDIDDPSCLKHIARINGLMIDDSNYLVVRDPHKRPISIKQQRQTIAKFHRFVDDVVFACSQKKYNHHT